MSKCTLFEKKGRKNERVLKLEGSKFRKNNGVLDVLFFYAH
jgi:hypothetical protein